MTPRMGYYCHFAKAYGSWHRGITEGRERVWKSPKLCFIICELPITLLSKSGLANAAQSATNFKTPMQRNSMKKVFSKALSRKGLSCSSLETGFKLVRTFQNLDPTARLVLNGGRSNTSLAVASNPWQPLAIRGLTHQRNILENQETSCLATPCLKK